jgi:dihydroorotate dehydrogenase (NAD+) catalytic subunit
VAAAVSVPVIGMGGIMTVEDALEFFFAGASAVQVGTGIFVDPTIPIRLIDGLADWMTRQGVSDLNDIVGAALPGRRETVATAIAAG